MQYKTLEIMRCIAIRTTDGVETQSVIRMRKAMILMILILSLVIPMLLLPLCKSSSVRRSIAQMTWKRLNAHWMATTHWLARCRIIIHHVHRTASMKANTKKSAVGYLNWYPGEPNDVGGEDCGELQPYGAWNDLPCNIKR